MVGCKGNDCVASKSRIQGLLKQEAVIGKNSRRELSSSRRELSSVIADFTGTPPVVRVKRIGEVYKEDEYPKAPRKNPSTARVHRTVTRKLSAIIGNIFGPAPHVIHRRGLSEKIGKFHQRPSKLSNGSPHPDPIVETPSEHLPSAARAGAMEKGGVGALELVAMSDKGAKFEIVDIPLEANMMEVEPQQTEDNDVQHTMLEITDPMEVDMEVICPEDNEPVLDIDVAERKNPLAVTEYIEEIFKNYKRREHVVPMYMAQQDNINERARGVLVDWLVETHYKLNLLDETLYLAVNILDNFLALQGVSKNHIQLVGVASLVLASKYEEVHRWIIKDVISLCGQAFSRQSILQMEKVIINKLNFDLSFPTPYAYVHRFLRAGKCDTKLEVLSFFLLELCLVDYKMLRFPPSLLVAASIFTSQCTLRGHDKEWTKSLESYTGYCREDLMECSKKIVGLHQTIGSSPVLCSVWKKYSSKYGGFASPTPAFFLLDK